MASDINRFDRGIRCLADCCSYRQRPAAECHSEFGNRVDCTEIPLKLCTHRYTEVHNNEPEYANHEVGIRQFREKFASYVGSSDQPIAITRHGDTVGYYVPARPRWSDEEKATLTQAVAKLHAVLNENGISSEEIFKQLRRLQRGAVEKVDEPRPARAERGA